MTPAETHCGEMSAPAAISASRRSASAQVSATHSEIGARLVKWDRAVFGGGKMPDCPGEGPVAELVPGVEAEEDAGRADAVDDAGLELERVGGEVGKVPEPGAGVVTLTQPTVMPVRRWATGVGVTSGAA